MKGNVAQGHYIRNNSKVFVMMYIFVPITQLKQVHTHLWNVHGFVIWDHVIEGMYLNSIA